MLTDNIMFLKQNYPTLLENTRNKGKESLIEIETTKNGEKTIKLKKDDTRLYLHSKYNPTREAEAIIDKIEEREDINENSHIIFYGLGLGYHIEIFVKKHPNTKFSLYEPSIEVFNAFLDQVNLRNLGTKNIETIACEYDIEVRQSFLNEIINKIDEKVIIVELPIYEKAFKQQNKEFLDSFSSAIKNKRSSIHTDYAFQKRWTINSVANFKDVLETPNILMQDKDLFKDKTAIIVAAGPSLELEIENLKKIRQENSAYMFSVGSAINTLIHHDILPHAVCTYDPGAPNQMVFKKMNEMGIDYIPMFFGSSVGLEVLEQFKGPKYHMITSQDTVSSYFLRDSENRDIPAVNDAPSIAVITLQMLYKMGFKKIILVGQNLAYSGDKTYAGGIEYYEDKKINLDGSIKVKDVHGNEIYTNQGFNSMRLQMEMYIQAFEDLEVINTTQNGANIEGTQYVELDKIFEKNSNLPNIQEFKDIIIDNSYDKDYMLERKETLTREYENYKNQLRDLRSHISKIKQLIKNNNLSQLDNMYTKLDEKTGNLNINDFFKVIVKPMHRLIYDILSTRVTNAKYNKNPIEKANEIVGGFDMFLNSLLFSQNDFESIYLLLLDRIDI